MRIIWTLLTAAVASTAFAGDARIDAYQISEAEVTVVCPLTVGGSFEAKTKDINGELSQSGQTPGAMTGAIKVNLQTLETGIGVRDRHMRSTYLEVEKGSDFAVAVVDDVRLDSLQGKTTFRGMLTLHGTRQEVRGTAEVAPRDRGYRVRAEFPIKVSAFQIPAPVYLGIGVKDEIRVKVAFVAAATSSSH